MKGTTGRAPVQHTIGRDDPWAADALDAAAGNLAAAVGALKAHSMTPAEYRRQLSYVRVLLANLSQQKREFAGFPPIGVQGRADD